MKDAIEVKVSATGGTHGVASEKLLSNNIECYQDTVPSMLSDRLRNSKFSGPEGPQTGLAPEWEPASRCQGVYSCRLIPGMYLSGREAQLIHNFGDRHSAEVTQTGVNVRTGEEFEVEMWARAHNRPITVTVSLSIRGSKPEEHSSATMEIDQAHWVRRTCKIKAPGEGGAAIFTIAVPRNSRLVIDQVHLRPVGEPHVAPALLEAFDEIPCTALRFPGGCMSCTYHWEHGIGPVHLRPVCDDPVFKYKTHYGFGTDEYLALCVSKGIAPFITLNTTTDTPESAAAWAVYVRNYYTSNSLPVPVASFMFGNENYGTHEIGHMTGEMYLAQLREFVPGVRAAYPEARILALGEYESQGLRDEHASDLRSLLINEGADLFDVLAVTRYSGGADCSFDVSIPRVAEAVRGKEQDLRKQAQSLRDAGIDRKIAVVEWNYWTRAGHNDHAEFYEPNDIRHCLYAAGYMNAFCRMGEIMEMANYYSLVNTMGMIRLHDGQLEISDVAKVFKLFEPALPGEVLELSTGDDLVDANFIRSGEEFYGFLVNFSHDSDVRVTLEGLGSIQEAVGIAADSILSPVDEITPEFGGSTVTLPPASLVRVTAAPI